MNKIDRLKFAQDALMNASDVVREIDRELAAAIDFVLSTMSLRVLKAEIEEGGGTGCIDEIGPRPCFSIEVRLV